MFRDYILGYHAGYVDGKESQIYVESESLELRRLYYRVVLVAFLWCYSVGLLSGISSWIVNDDLRTFTLVHLFCFNLIFLSFYKIWSSIRDNLDIIEF